VQEKKKKKKKRDFNSTVKPVKIKWSFCLR
jgi:hypothetical protein